jgi:hypothetical protein
LFIALVLGYFDVGISAVDFAAFYVVGVVTLVRKPAAYCFGVVEQLGPRNVGPLLACLGESYVS